MKILHLGNQNSNAVVSESVACLKSGGLVVAPSDTVYGLLVDASNEKAVRKLIEFKDRPLSKSISVFLPALESVDQYVEITANQKATLSQLVPGPFTVVLPSNHKTSSLLESEKGTLGIRIPEYQFVTNLVKAFGRATTATSANLAGRSPHYSVESLLNDLPESKKQLIDLVIDAGKLPRNKPSTVIDLTSPKVKIIRQGDISFNEKQEYFSESPSQTKKIATYIFNKTLSKNKSTVFILQGELGTGKTMFVKGIAESLGITNIISPTFAVAYEYSIKKHTFLNMFHHIDLYNIEDPEEFKHLGIENLLKPGSVSFLEWGEKSGEILDMFKQNAHIVFVHLEYKDKNKRAISVS